MTIADAIRRILGRSVPTVGELARKLEVRGADGPQTVSQEPPREAPQSDPIEVQPEYLQVEELIAAGAPLSFITGGAGTGKSTFIRYLVSRRPGDLVVLAPTGVAALNVGGMTIHSFCRFPPTIVRREDVKPAADRNLVSRMNVLVIDEVSMLRPDLLDGIDLFLRRSRGNNRLFGGIPAVLVGDLFQLPPVITREEAPALRAMGYTHDWFFSARCLREAPLASVFLTRVFRQKDPDFVALLNQMRIGTDVLGIVSRLNRRAVPLPDSAALELTLTATNAVADERNQRALDQISSPVRLYMGSIQGDFGMGQARLPSPIDLQLKVGAQVMFTKNDNAKRFVNGTLGRVVGLGDGQVSVQIEEAGRRAIVEVQPASWERFKYFYNPATDQIDRQVAARYTQIPLMLAWAVTIHKAQGKTFERANVDLGRGAFAAGQTYVAVSRLQTEDGLRLAVRLRPSDIRCDPLVREFYREIGGLPGD